MIGWCKLTVDLTASSDCVRNRITDKMQETDSMYSQKHTAVDEYKCIRPNKILTSLHTNSDTYCNVTDWLTPLLYLVWSTNQAIVSTALLYDITYQMLLSIVRGQYGDLVSRVTNHSHVHEHCHCILSLGQVLQHTQLQSLLTCIVTILFIHNKHHTQ